QAWLFLAEQSGRRLSALANWYSFSWQPVFLGAPDTALQARLLEAIALHLVKNCAHIDAYPVAMPDLLLASFRRAGWLAVQRPMGCRHLLHLHGRDFAAYWADRPGKLRSIVKRKTRDHRFMLSITHRLTDELWRDY